MVVIHWQFLFILCVLFGVSISSLAIPLLVYFYTKFSDTRMCLPPITSTVVLVLRATQ